MNSEILLIRNGNKTNTPGTLSVGDFKCLTLELPWLDNKQNFSCIPTGRYEWIKRNPTKAIPYEHILLINVPARAGVCIHYGNYAGSKKSDVLGCILTGLAFADINGDGVKDITDSKKTFSKLMSILPSSGFITIK